MKRKIPYRGEDEEVFAAAGVENPIRFVQSYLQGRKLGIVHRWALRQILSCLLRQGLHLPLHFPEHQRSHVRVVALPKETNVLGVIVSGFAVPIQNVFDADNGTAVLVNSHVVVCSALFVAHSRP